MRSYIFALFVTLVTAFPGFAALSDILGVWEVVSENGEPVSGYYKGYFADGTFNVTHINERVAAGGDVVCAVGLEQSGLWGVDGNDAVVERCSMGDKGDVVVDFSIDGDTMTQTFAYASNPGKRYVQKFRRNSTGREMRVGNVGVKVGKCDDSLVATLRERMEVPGGEQDDRCVYLIGDKRITAEEYRALPQESVQMVSVIHTAEALNELTAEELAAGKTGIVRVTLKD